jgi:hypothetical protein
VTSKPIKTEILKTYKNNIAQIIYNLDEEHDVNFVKALKKSGVPFALSTELSEDFVKSIKIHYMDYQQIIRSVKSKKEDIKNLEDLNNLYYKSNKITISNGKIYNSKAAYLKDVPFNNKPIKVIDIPEFWEEAKYFYLFELT